jgi:hypothetical protein
MKCTYVLFYPHKTGCEECAVKMDMERFNLKLNESEVKEQYQVTIKTSLQL